MSGFRCPSCGFRVFSRGYPFCEGCAKPLPAELLFSAEEIAARQRDAEQRAALRRETILAGPPGGEALPGIMGVILDL